jgi:hypothetical protein
MLPPPTGRLSARWSEFLTSPLYDLAPVGYDAGRGPNGRLRVRVLQLSRCAPVTFQLCKPGETRVTVTRGGVIGRDATFQCT